MSDVVSESCLYVTPIRLPISSPFSTKRRILSKQKTKGLAKPKFSSENKRRRPRTPPHPVYEPSPRRSPPERNVEQIWAQGQFLEFYGNRSLQFLSKAAYMSLSCFHFVFTEKLSVIITNNRKRKKINEKLTIIPFGKLSNLMHVNHEFFRSVVKLVLRKVTFTAFDQSFYFIFYLLYTT